MNKLKFRKEVPTLSNRPLQDEVDCWIIAARLNLPVQHNEVAKFEKLCMRIVDEWDYSKGPIHRSLFNGEILREWTKYKANKALAEAETEEYHPHKLDPKEIDEKYQRPHNDR